MFGWMVSAPARIVMKGVDNMIKFKCLQKNFDVMVRLRLHGKPLHKYVHFDEKGEAVFANEEGFNGKIIARLRAEIGKETIKGLKEMRGGKK